MTHRTLENLKKRTATRRMAVFADGAKTVILPNPAIRGKQVERLYAHEHARMKTGTMARALINYFHYPVDCHQENLEDAPLHAALAKATDKIVALPLKRLRELLDAPLADIDKWLPAGRSATTLRLRDALFPLSARVFYSLVFGVDCPPDTARRISISTLNVLKTIKGLTMLKSRRRMRAFAAIRAELERQGGCPQFFETDAAAGVDLTLDIRAKHLQGVIFTTGVIQVSEFASHALVALAQRPEMVERILHGPDSERFLEHVMTETLRMYPLVGITNRVLKEDIALDDGGKIERGMQLLFDFESHQRCEYESPGEFSPDRWRGAKVSEANFMPFGVGYRRCPAERIARAMAKEMVLAVLRRFTVHAPIEHTRALDGGGLCYLVRRDQPEPAPRMARLLHNYIQARDTAEQFRYHATKLIVLPRIARAAQRAKPPEADPSSPTESNAATPPLATCPFKRWL